MERKSQDKVHHRDSTYLVWTLSLSLSLVLCGPSLLPAPRSRQCRGMKSSLSLLSLSLSIPQSPSSFFSFPDLSLLKRPNPEILGDQILRRFPRVPLYTAWPCPLSSPRLMNGLVLPSPPPRGVKFEWRPGKLQIANCKIVPEVGELETGRGR